MLLVCLAHFGFVYFAAEGSPDGGLLYTVTMLASPTFMVISGMMMGFLAERRKAGPSNTARTLVGRGIFLLTVGHALIVISCIPRLGLDGALTRGFITDVIGAAIIVGPWLIPRLGVAARALLAAALYAAAMFVSWGWAPTAPVLALLDFALGGPNSGDPRVNFPLLPWLALYVLGSIAGSRLAALLRAGRSLRAELELAAYGVAAVVAAIGIKAGYMLLRARGVVAEGETPLYFITSFFQKFPPSLPYHFVYAGLGLVMTAAVLWTARQGYLTRALAALAMLGRASLFVFLLQFYVYYVGFHYLALPYSAWWPAYFALSLVPIWLAAALWLRLDLNYVFDVTRWWPGQQTARRSLAAAPVRPVPASPSRSTT